MPLVYQQDINSESKLGVWMILEPISYFEERVQNFKIINHPQKQIQHLAGRNLLRELHPDLSLRSMFDNTTKLDKPEEKSLNYSVTHSGKYAAVITDSTYRVGIDIEMPSEKAFKLRKKFINIGELEILLGIMKDEIHAATAGWCIKEAVFKWYGKGGVDFKNNISIVRARDADEELIFDCVFLKDKATNLHAKLRYVDEMIMVWISERN